MVGVRSTEATAFRQVFWDQLSPCLREQLRELAGVSSWKDLAELWGFNHHEEVRRYVRGPLRRRLEREGAAEWLRRCVMCNE